METKITRDMKNTYKYILACAMCGTLFCNGIIAQDQPSTDAIHATKEIIPTNPDNGEYKIHLETFVTGSSVTTVTETTKPVDLALVLDVSSSMITNAISSTAERIGTVRDITYDNYQDGSSDDNDYKYTNKGYILYNGQYYQLQREDEKVSGTRYYRVYINIGTTRNPKKIYLSGEGTTDKAPNTATRKDVVIATATVYQTRTKTRLMVLKEAVNAFIDKVEENAKGPDKNATLTEDNVSNRIAIVTFEKHEHYITGGSTELEASRSDSDYSDNFIDVLNADGTSNAATLKNLVSNLVVGEGTRQDRGVLAANNVFSAVTAARTAESAKSVVVFTDGSPYADHEKNIDGDGVSTSDGVRDKGIAYSYISKHTYDAKVFTVHMGLSAGTNMNFMNYMSSNYPDAQSMSNTGSGVTGGSPYCFDAGDGSNLTKIFEAIASSSTEGGETYPLDANTTSVIDVVSDNFIIPANVEVTIWHESCYGVDDDGEYLWAKSGDNYYSNGAEPSLTPSTDPQKVQVSGFNYAAEDEWNKDGTIKTKGNWVGARKDEDGEVIGYWGNKVVIEFPIKVNPDYEGGYAMPSNDITSGVYVGDVNVKPYPVPVVDFPSICIMKDGMAVGESALFEVSGPNGLHYTISLIQRANANGDPMPCYVILKRLNGGEYTVTEKNWTWLYNTTPTTKSISQTVISAEKMHVTVEEILENGDILENNGQQVGMSLSRQTVVSAGAEAGNYNHTFVALKDKTGEYEIDDLKESAISLLYYFSNTRATEGKAARAEAYAHNEFKGGKTTGGTETGGNEEEDM